MRIIFPKPLGGEFILVCINFVSPFEQKCSVVEITLFNRTIQFEFND